MTVGELRAEIEDMPDDLQVLVYTPQTDYIADRAVNMGDYLQISCEEEL